MFVSTVAVNETGDTPLSLECSRGDLEMVMALINKHVDPNSKSLSVALGWYNFRYAQLRDNNEANE